MAQFAYPKALTGMRDTEWSHFLRTFLTNGITRRLSFGAIADGGGMYVDLSPGEVLIEGVLHANDQVERVPLAPAGAAERIDVVVKRLNRENPGQVITTAVVQGVGGGGAPALTQDPEGIWEWPIAEVRVPTGIVVIADTLVTDRRSIAPLAPSRWSSVNRPTNERPTPLLGWNSSTGEWEYIRENGEVATVVPDTLGVSRGGTGAKTAAAARANLGAAAASHEHSAADITSGLLPISRGGTGHSTASAARAALGAAPTSHKHPWSDITGRPSSYPPSSHSHITTQISAPGGTNLDTWIRGIASDVDGKAAKSHTHTWGQVTGKPSTFKPSSHTHPWSQVTGRPSTYPPSSHSHSWGSITGRPSTFPPSSHSHSWSQVTGKPSTFTPSSHTHTAKQVNVFGTNVESYLSGLNSRIAKIEAALK